MKIITTFLILFFIFCINTANADDLATQTFIVDANSTIIIIITGTIYSSIDGATGNLSNAMNINFNITTNEDADSIRMRAYVLNSSNVKESAFYCTNTSQLPSIPLNLVLGAYTSGLRPTSSSIANCRQASSTSKLNPNAIAYPGTVSINNGGSVQYNSSNGYFTCKAKKGNSNLNLALTTVAKSGTYDANTALDEPDDYVAEVYLDNIPGV